MRSALLSVLVLSLATPAVAESRSQREMEKMADTLNSPVTQQVAAGAMTAMLAAILDLRLDGFAKAIEPLDPRKAEDMRGRTVRDLAIRDDPYFEDKIEGKTRAAVGSMGAMASAMAVMLPELERAARKMEDALPRSH
jgi:hypothetical protein